MSLRILIAVTHLLGVGHLTRAAAIGRGLAGRGHAVTLVSGGRPAPLVRTDGLRLVQLEPVQVRGTAFATLLDAAGTPLTAAAAARRRAVLRATYDAVQPDVVITELYPLGRRVLADEFTVLLEAARASAVRPLVLASVRDILAAPSKAARLVQAHDILRSFYDGVLVHADPAVVPLTASWPVAADLAERLRYTGYVDDPPPGMAAEPVPSGEIVVSGGGSAAGQTLFATALAAAARDPARRWRLLVGQGVGADLFAAWQAQAANVAVERARPDFRALLARCAVSVSQFGYNTALDLIATRARAVVVPFADGGETEQSERAALFAARGLVTALDGASLDPGTLLAGVDAALRRPAPDASGIAIDGATRTAEIVEKWVAARPARAPARLRRFDFTPLVAAIERHPGTGPLPFWWRDDDAIVTTRALTRLIAVARRYAAPLAVASIPGRAQAELAEALAGKPMVTVLVHGLTHANHAPPDQKKAEFGAHRGIDELATEAAGALNLARRRFGAALLPVFVPPWNRVAPALVERLPGLGYGGLSTANDRTAPEPVPGLRQVNTHIDPIDWHGTRSLADPERIVADLARAVAHRAGAAEPEPIGLLTHHLVHDDMIWSFVEELLATLAGHAGARIASAPSMFAAPLPGPGPVDDGRSRLF
ncbi:glycosyltransferase [Chelatococcus reniformis]|uniref:Glycosyl transferase family 28 C-terminal domain-containing protein n=1 Tax=Chelatococcus reniformis TaxID=1494448 RepID=A0A916U058_9HYPH|nr:glycosyltransferase [Chelatococcus reniformis]GGC54993.1 hypothetical protein GCM10010994_12380 [Chelatococcus reniformis]